MPEIRDTIRHPLLRQFYDYWDSRRGERRFPARSALDPMDFKFALGRASLVDVMRDPLRFRYRLVASYLTDHLGFEMTGKLADEIPAPGMRAYTVASYTRAVEANAPLHQAEDVMLDGQRWRHEALFLPLSTDGDTIDMLAVCRVTDPPKKRAFSGMAAD